MRAAENLGRFTSIKQQMVDRLTGSGELDLDAMRRTGGLTTEEFDQLTRSDPHHAEAHERDGAAEAALGDILPDDRSLDAIADRVDAYDASLLNLTPGAHGQTIEEILNSPVWPVGGTRSDRS